MSIAALNELSTETRRLAIAGASLAPGDFRLQKLIEPLEKSGQVAPVFAKVAEAVRAVVDADEKSAAGALLDLATLTNAILYTQGRTGVEGDLAAIDTSPVEGTTTRTSYRVLAPLIEALTQAGQGRFEVVADALARGGFRDVRLVRPAIQALGDRYGELATLVGEKVLPAFGPGIAPLLQSGLDPKGGTVHARRLRALSRIDPDGAREAARELMDEATKDVKIAAIEALRGSEQDLELLLAETESKVKDVRRAAYSSLAGIRARDAVERLHAAVGTRDLELISETIGDNLSDDLVDSLVAEGELLLEAVTAGCIPEKGEGAGKSLPKQATLIRLIYLLRALAGNLNATAEAFVLIVFEQRAYFSKLPSAKLPGEQVNEEVAILMSTVASDAAKRQLVDQRETLSVAQLGYALLASAQTDPSKDVFKKFSELLSDKDRGPLIESVLGGWGDSSELPGHLKCAAEQVEWDAGWIKAAIKADRHRLVCNLLKGPHRAAESYLVKKLDFKGKEGRVHSPYLLETLVRVEHKGAAKLVCRAVDESASLGSYHWEKWQYLSLIPRLPISAVKEIEAFVKKLPEKRADEVLPYLAELKAKAATTSKQA